MRRSYTPKISDLNLFATVMGRGCEIALVALTLMLLVLPASPGLAQGRQGPDDVFTVRGVGVDVTAESALLARTEARRTGQRAAHQRMITRLTLRAHHERLPELGDEEVAALVESFEVDNEKTSTVRYIAEMTFKFKANEVRLLLRDLGVPFAETRSKPVLVLPIFETGGEVTLWEDTTPWLAAWSRYQAADGLVPLRVPLGDLTDISTIGADQALTGNRELLDKVAARYGADDTFVVFARLPESFVPGVELAVTTSRYGAAGLDQTIVDTVQARPDDTFEGFLFRAVSTVITRVEERWKRDNLIAFDRRQTLALKAFFEDLDQWLSIQRGLGGIALVGTIEIVYLTRKEAGLELSYFGDPEQLTLALEQADLVLEQGSVSWELRLAAMRPRTDHR